MSDRGDFALPLDLPDWNQGIKGLFTQPRMPGDQAPAPSRDHHLGSARRVLASTQAPQQATHHPAKRLHDPAAAHAEGLDQLPNANDAEFWLRKAADLEAPQAEEVLMEGLRRDAQPVTSIARALHELHKRVENSPVEGSQGYAPLSPSRLPSAMRSLTPSRTGLTGKAMRVPSRLADTPGAAGAVPPPTKFHGILKKLQFSAAGPSTEEPHDTGSIPVPVPATTTTKRLHFCDGTPLATSLPGPTGLKASARRVTFGADTVSPATHRPHRGSGAPDFSFSFNTTPGAIAEGEEEGEEEDGGAAGGTVNSRNAGATPFDRRLSALFAKYSDDEGAAVGDGEDKEEQEQEQGTPDLWKRMSSVAAIDSIRKLTALDVQNEEKEEVQEAKEAEMMSPNTAIASVLGELLRRSLEDINASKAAAEAAQPRELPAGTVSPTAGVLSVAPSPARTASAQPSTPALSLTPMSIDGVPRDEHGIPLVTPGTVTMFRGTSQAPERDDGIAADLFRSFDTPEVAGEATAVAPSAAAEVTEVSGPRSRNTGGSGRSSPEFEFRPLPAAAPAVPAAPSATPVASSDATTDGDTPDLQLRPACHAKSGRLSPDSEAAMAATVAATTPAPTPANTPLRASGIRLTPAASSIIASLGKAQRVLSPAPPAAAAADAAADVEAPVDPAPQQFTPPPSITKELRGLMEGMTLATPAPEVVTVVTLGDDEADANATPARRSTRLAAASTARKPDAPVTVEEEGHKESVAEEEKDAVAPLEVSSADVAGPSAPKTTPTRAKRTPRASKPPAPSPAPRYGLRSASKATRPPAAAEETPGAAGPSATRSRRRSTVAAAAGDKALKLSPTEQSIRSELRRSSRRKSTLEPSN